MTLPCEIVMIVDLIGIFKYYFIIILIKKYLPKEPNEELPRINSQSTHIEGKS